MSNQRHRRQPQLPTRTQPNGHRPPPSPPPSAERQLLDAIANGELDHHLSAIADAVHARRHLLHTVRSATALGELCVGDHVRINHTVSPRYLHGRHGVITDIDDQRATVCLHQPVGRFRTGEIRCPPLALDKIADSTS